MPIDPTPSDRDPSAERGTTAYRLSNGRIVHVVVVTAPPIITYALAPGILVSAIRADLKEPY
jgi:hypothetical protein